MADISKITLPNGSAYDIKDATARSSIPTTVQQLNVVVDTEDPATINPSAKGWAEGTLYFWLKP